MNASNLTITPCAAVLGATVEGLDLHQPLDERTIAELRRGLVEHEVLFFPGASLSPGEQVRFGRGFGELEVHAALDAFPDAPEVVVFDTDREAVTAEWWHADVTCAPAPPLGSILEIVIAPPMGGATHWASMSSAYDALDDDVKARIEGLHALHRSWWEPVEESVHPVVCTHPESGRKVLFVNGIFTKRIVELEEGESKELLAHLCEHAIRDEFTVRHDWHAGDIAFWDNRSTQHRVDNDFGEHRRRGHRIVINGDVPA